MSDGVKILKETMQRIERLLTRYELDMAGRLHAVDYQATIAMLCERFEVQMRGLAQVHHESAASAHSSARSSGFGFSIPHIKGEST